ncbi:MAG: Gfo/Idh/MocA family oxidoreductase [Nanoarchaeota archaeon]|nr:Gfo/Idh/MocA family oxidoreductase [Nanoarchaeota archaeon]
MNKTNNWAVVGLGFVSPRHIKSIQETGGTVLMTCDRDKTKALDEFPFFDDFGDMLNSPEFEKVDNVAILTPNYLHYYMIQMAVHKGKRVLCEKPLALSSCDIKRLSNDGSTGVVLQLHYHPEIIKLKKKLKGKKVSGSLTVKVKRDKPYWDCWKGDMQKSGGIVLNIGIHYIDLLMQLNGIEYKILEHHYSPKLATGKIDFNGGIFDYHIEIMDTAEGQTRSLIIDDEKIELSTQDNLSFEDLHTEVYKDFNKGIIVTPEVANHSIKLIEQLSC